MIYLISCNFSYLSHFTIFCAFKVSGLSIFERESSSAARTNNIEVRVGFRKPFRPGREDYRKYDYNNVCGTIAGPGIANSISTLTCDGKVCSSERRICKQVEKLKSHEIKR